MGFDSAQFKFANNLDEALTFCIRGFSYRQELFEGCKMLDGDPNYKITKSVFTRKTTFGEVRYLSSDGLVCLDLDNVVPANHDVASNCSLMFRYMHVHGQHREQGLFKRTVQDVTEIYKPSRFCVTLAIKPEGSALYDEQQTQKYLSLKQAMRNQFEKLGWVRLSLLAFANGDPEIIDRNGDPVHGCISMVLIGENAPAKAAAFYRSMEFGGDVL